MEIEAFINKMKDINSALLDFIDASADDCDESFRSLVTIFEKYEVLQHKEENGQLLFRLISKIVENHHRSTNFFSKIGKIFQFLYKEKFPSNFMSNCKEHNKSIFLLLLQNGLIEPGSVFIDHYIKSITETKSTKNMKKYQFYYFLYPGMKRFIDENDQKKIEKEILQKFNENEISDFEEKCQKGENDSYICLLIRNDSVEDFIVYVNRNNTSLISTRIKPTIYETNSFLIDKEPTIIEYASFYGSIQIIQYLKYNNVPLTNSMWLHAIHSNNAELIHFLEENEVKLETIENGYIIRSFDYDYVLEESIKCHHSDISNYIKDNLLSKEQIDDEDELSYNFDLCILDSLNFYFFKKDVGSLISEIRNENGFNLHNLLFSQTVITIPSNITSIGANAFEKCSKLTQIIIPSSVTEIDSKAFSGCSSLTQISIPPSIKTIKDYTFNGCSSLEEIIIPSSVTEIGNYSFNGCCSLKEIVIPSSVTSICEYSFSDCKSLKQLSIPSSVKSIGCYAFYRCTSLEQIEILSTITHISDSTFSYCTSLSNITIPTSVNLIGKNAFYGCKSLNEITFPSSIKSIDGYAFYGCSSLAKISFPSSIETIGNFAFYNCSSLTEVFVPSSVTSIGRDAFSGCSSLKQISLPSSGISIGKMDLASSTEIIYN